MDSYNLAVALSVMCAMEEQVTEKPTWHPMYRPYGDGPYPSMHQTIWIMRDQWKEPHLTSEGHIHPQMNVLGLYWSPAKDGEGPPEWKNTNG